MSERNCLSDAVRVRLHTSSERACRSQSSHGNLQGRQAEFSHTHMQTKFGSLCAMLRRRTTLETFLAAPGGLSSTQRSLIFWELEAVSRIQKGCLVALAIQYYSSSWLRFSGGWKWQKNDGQKHKELLEAERSKCVAGSE